METRAKVVEVPLQSGVNRIRITTEKECQGTYEEDIYFDGSYQISLFPNPTADGQLTIGIPGNDERVMLEIMDISGSMLYKRAVAVQSDRLVNVNLSNLPTGIYSVRINGRTIHDTVKLIRK